MKRYAICPVIGDGTESFPYQPKVPVGLNYVSIIPAKEDGTPMWPWALVEVAGPTLTAIDNDAEIDAFPNMTMNILITSLSKSMQRRIDEILVRRGVNAVFDPSTTVADLINIIGRHLDVNFSWEQTFVTENMDNN
jgi:hypothetical protein